MPKYYVESGDLKACVSAENATEAVKTAILKVKPESLSMMIHISETGFDSSNLDDGFLLLPEILHELGLIDDPEEMTQDFLNSLYGEDNVS